MTERAHAAPLVLRWAAISGFDLGEIVLAAGLPPSVLGAPEGISYDDGMRLWRALETLSGDRYIGLHLGARVTLDSLGMLGPAFAASPDLAAGIRLVATVLPHVLGHTEIELVEDETGAGLRYRALDPGVRHGVDSMFAALVTLARECTRAPIVPEVVELESPPPPSADRYVSVLGRAPRFGCASCRLVFSREDLDRPFRGADPETATVLVANAERLVRRESVSERARIESALRRSLERGDGSLAGTAALLGVAPRTLQRRLGALDLRFAHLLAETRRQLAEERLAAGAPVAQVASSIGYASRTAFVRAFTTWTGQPPSAYRARR